jgi:hypothetical protein
MTAPQLTTDAILGANFLVEYQVIMDFTNRSFSTKKGDIVTRHNFFFDVMAGGGRESRSVSNPNNLADFSQSLQTLDEDRSRLGLGVKGTNLRDPDIPESRGKQRRRISGGFDNSYDAHGEVNPLLLGVRREDVNVEDSGARFPGTLNISRVYENPEEGSDAVVQHYNCYKTSKDGSALQEYDHDSDTEQGDARSVSVQELRAKVRASAISSRCLTRNPI